MTDIVIPEFMDAPAADGVHRDFSVTCDPLLVDHAARLR